MAMKSVQATGGALRAKDAAAFLAVAPSTFWRWVAEGRLPKGKKIGQRCTVWLKDELAHWLANAGQAEG